MCEIKSRSDVPLSLLCAFYVYNICFPRGCGTFYCFFLDIVLLDNTPKKSHRQFPISLTHSIA